MESILPPNRRSWTERVRRRAGGLAVDSFFRGLAHLGKLAPAAKPHKHGVRLVSDVPYSGSGRSDHLLDIYIPEGFEGPRPVVLYAHGGGFRILSKDTHWMMGLAFARRGFLVFNINYRLAPEHPFPAAIQDTCRAYSWVVENASRWGGDTGQLVVAGESAGANLATALTLSTCYERPEPWASEVFQTGVIPSAVIAACGMLQVSDAARLYRDTNMPRFIADRLDEVTEAYLGLSPADGGYDLADPLVLLERGEAPTRELPPFFAPVGTRDPLIDDTRRLEKALTQLGTPCHAAYYPGEVHAFHAFLWRRQARECWKAQYDFLEKWLQP